MTKSPIKNPLKNVREEFISVFILKCGLLVNFNLFFAEEYFL